jgi:hypothetical protein
MMKNWATLPKKRPVLVIGFVTLSIALVAVRYLTSSSTILDSTNIGKTEENTFNSSKSTNIGNSQGSSTNNSSSPDDSAIIAQPISPDDSSFSDGPSPLSNPPISNPFAESNGQPKTDPVADSSTTTPSTQPPIPQPPLSAPPTTLPDVFSKTGIPPDCSVRLITLTENERPRRIIQVAVRNNVSMIWVKAGAGLKEQVQGLPVRDHYAETTLTITDLPVRIFVFGSEFQEATSLGCTTLVNR